MGGGNDILSLNFSRRKMENKIKKVECDSVWETFFHEEDKESLVW